MRKRTGFGVWLPFFLVLFPGLTGVALFGYHSLFDWAGLKTAYAHYREVVAATPEQQELFVAEADQNIQRINLFADGTWTLLSGIIAAIGIHGICCRRTVD